MYCWVDIIKGKRLFCKIVVESQQLMRNYKKKGMSNIPHISHHKYKNSIYKKYKGFIGNICHK